MTRLPCRKDGDTRRQAIEFFADKRKENVGEDQDEKDGTKLYAPFSSRVNEKNRTRFAKREKETHNRITFRQRWVALMEITNETVVLF
jgi:hypothetical protein